jgi:transcriptional antiterminator RfaH
MARPIECSAWFCVRTQPKHEQIAAAHLSRISEIEVFNPKLRIRRATRRGAVWFVEALFPGYLFARFDWDSKSQTVRGTPGVSTLVAFGPVVPVVPDAVVEALRSQFDETESHEIPDQFQNGDSVTIAGGPFHGLQATVLRVMSARDRIQVLLDILGGDKPVEISTGQVAPVEPRTQAQIERTPFGKDA